MNGEDKENSMQDDDLGQLEEYIDWDHLDRSTQRSKEHQSRQRESRRLKMAIGISFVILVVGMQIGLIINNIRFG